MKPRLITYDKLSLMNTSELKNYTIQFDFEYKNNYNTLI